MSRQKFTSTLLVFALAGLTGLAGCESPQSTGRASTDQQRSTASQKRSTTSQTRTTAPASQTRSEASQKRSTPPPARTAEAPAPAPAPARTGTWPTMSSSDSMAVVAMAYPTGTASTSAIGLEKVVPREVRANQPFEYQMIVTNLTSQSLSGVTVTDQVQDGLRILGSNPQGRTLGEGTHSWDVGDLGPRESRTIRVNGVASGEGVVAHCASVTYASTLCATIPVVQPKLRLTKSGPAEALRCEAITYQIEVSNTGTGTISNVRITDPLPDGLTAAGGGRTLSFDAGSLAAGASRRFSATVQADRTGRFSNNATATGEAGLTVESNAVATVVRQPVLAISKTCPELQFIGRPINYEISVTNSGDGPARDLIVEDQIPAGGTFVSASDGGRAAGGRVTWNLGTLAPEASKKITLSINPGGAGTYRNTVTARAYCADPVSDSCETNVTGIPAILLEVVDINDPVRVGDEETYVITVTNQGSAAARSIRIVCNLEQSATFVSAAGSTSGSHRAGVVTFEPVASLEPQAKATWRVVVRAAAEADARFKVSMTSSMIQRPVEETEATHFYK